MVDDVFEERNVRFHTANAELAQRAVHAPSFREFRAPRGDFYEKRIVVGSKDRTSVGRATVETDSKSGRRSVSRKLSVIGSKIFFGIFGCDSALQRCAVQHHVWLLRKRERLFVQLVALRHENL